MKLTLTEQEVVEYLSEEYDVDEQDARDAVVAAKVLDIIDPKMPNDGIAEIIYDNRKCW